MLSRQRPTPCPCCNIHYKANPQPSYDIRSYLSDTKLQSLSLPNSLTPRFVNPTATAINLGNYRTREDLIRGEHDRCKIHLNNQ